MQFDKVIKSRRSVRKYSNKKPDWREILECIDSASYAPTAGNNFVLKVILVDDKNKINELAEAAQQSFISQTNFVIVVCSDSSRLENAYNSRGKIYSHQQAGAAIENIILSLQNKGLATCWVGHFEDNMVKRILKIPKDNNVEAIISLGYPCNIKECMPRKKPKIELEKYMFYNEYGERKFHNPTKTMDV